MERHDELHDAGDPDAAELLLTAYALDELDAPERAEVEARLARDPAARAEVERLRELGGELRHELSEEAQAAPAPGLAPEQRRAIDQRLGRKSGALRRMWLLPALAAALLVTLGLLQLSVRVDGLGGSARPRPEQVAMDRSRSDAPAKLRQLPYLGDAKDELASGSPSGEEVSPEILPATTSGPAPDNSMREPVAGSMAARAPAAAPAPSKGPETFSRAALPDPHVAEQLQQLGYVGASNVETRLSLHGRRGGAKDDPRSDSLSFPQPAPGTESYGAIVERSFLSPTTDPLSTFSIDVDTASYANVRRFLLKDGRLPPADAVRLEELVNYFHYDYPQPEGEAPFGVSVTVTECPWALQHRLVRVGLRGREVAVAERAPSNLVFLCDVSGSMNEPDKLPLLVTSLRLLVQKLDGRDRVALVTYAGNAGLVLDSTVCTSDGQQRVLDALQNLRAGGSTAGAAGIQLAYQVAREHFIAGGTNRVILATDGDFNVGISDNESLGQLITDSAKSGVFLSVLGFGTGNLQDGKAETLADKGNGNYAYIDSVAEAQKVLVQQMRGTLITIAKDVKVQVEFNPARVASYRLLGYEDRALAAQDFRNDRKDAGEIGSGHTVTALYEVVPVGAESAPGTDPLRYQPAAPAAVAAPRVDSPELLFLKLRWKRPDGEVSTEQDLPVIDGGGTLAGAGPDTGFAAAVAAFAMLLCDSEHAGDATFDSVLSLADRSRGSDKDGYRAEFIRIVEVAKGLSGK